MTGANNLGDRHGRSKRKLRVSLTDRCNFRCPYCMPVKPDWLPKAQLLTRPELRRLLTLFVRDLGITQLRLTGGEPLLRKDVADIIAESAGLRAHGLERVSLTTNGVLLAEQAVALKAAGLDDVNVSLDALSDAAFKKLSGGRSTAAQVQAGILAARAAGLPVKINTVAMRGYNEAEILPLVRWASQQRISLRLIEFMPLDGGGQWNQQRVIPEAEMLGFLKDEFQITPLAETDDPARYYLLNGSYPLGVISTISRPFCKRCDRLRITASGELFACLFSARGHDLRVLMREGATDAEVLARIKAAVWNKSAGYAQEGAASGYVERPITMHTLGG
jgi:cyclic pyranopterin phosphate synthase